jgi:hypothetical protein
MLEFVTHRRAPGAACAPANRAEALALGMDPRRALRFCFRHSLYPPQLCVVDDEIAAI